MSDNVLQTLQRLVQDVIAPDVRELKVRLEWLAHETDIRFQGVDARFDALGKQMESMHRSILSAIAESRAQTELAGANAMAAVRERLAVLESQRNQPPAQ